MMVTVMLFAILRERAGRNCLQLQLPDGATVADALQALSRVPALAGVLDRLPVQMAVNRDYASPHTVLQGDDELALIPPMSGGAPGPSAASGGAGAYSAPGTGMRPCHCDRSAPERGATFTYGV